MVVTSRPRKQSSHIGVYWLLRCILKNLEEDVWMSAIYCEMQKRNMDEWIERVNG